MRLLEISDEVIEIGRTHGPSWHGGVESLAGRVDTLGDGAAQRLTIVAFVVAVAVGVTVVLVGREKCLCGQGRGLDPELRPKPSAFPLGTMTANATSTVYPHVHVHVAVATNSIYGAARGAAAGEIDSFAI